MITRRDFLRGATTGLALMTLPMGTGKARAATSRNVLVVVYLRGGADGLSLVVPHGDPEYANLRPTLAVPGSETTPLDGFFGMHGAMPELAQLFSDRRLSVLHCTGSMLPTRSHFDAQDFMERAAPGNKSIQDGWLNRYLALRGQDSVLAGLSIGWSHEAALAGPAPSLSMTSLSDFRISGPFPEEQKGVVNSLYGGMPESILARRMGDMLSVESQLTAVDTDTETSYPEDSFARSLRDLAALIRGDVGVHVASVSLGGWDHHDGQLAQFPGSAARLSAGLNAFYQDLGQDGDRVLTLVMTEFGRTVEENGTFGSDHGRGSVMMAIGGGISGGNILLKDDQWPGLTQPPGWPRRDLEVTTDFRDSFAEVLDRHLGVNGSQLSGLFPDFEPNSDHYPGWFGG